MADNYDHEDDEALRGLEDEGAERQDPPAQQRDKTRTSLPEPLYRIQVEHSHETHYAFFEAEPGAEPLPARSHVVALTRYGKDLCLLLGVVKSPGYVDPAELIHIERPASPEDLARRASHVDKEAHAFSVCQDKIMTHGLPMKLVSAHFLLEEPKVLFFFTADARVDFRELVKDLVSIFKMRIELRQIGVRDEARVTGGCGICGRVLCCHGLTDKLVPVSIKMAKDQNLSLNSMKISGPCGRLLCCLAYEFGFYRENRRKMPSEGTRFNYDGATFRVIEVNVPAERLRLSGDDGRVLELTSDKFAQVDGRWTIKS